MTHLLSPRLKAIVDALPLRPGVRVLEVGCGTGAMLREIARRSGDGFALGIDRSPRAIASAEKGSRAELDDGLVAFRCVAVEDFELEPDEAPFDFAVAVRVGVLDGRYPERERLARARLRSSLVTGGKLYIDGGDPLRETPLSEEPSDPGEGWS